MGKTLERFWSLTLEIVIINIKRQMSLFTNKVWLTVFVIGLLALSLLLYLFFSGSLNKAEAGQIVPDTQNGEVIVVVGESGFKPKNIVLPVGMQVKWVNSGKSNHSVAFGLESSLENLTRLNQNLEPGESVTFKFEKRGSFRYFDINTSNDARIEVK